MQRAHFRFLQPKKFLLYRFFDYLCTANRGVEQLAARWAHNPKVGGSSPPPATKKESNVFGEGTLLFCFMTLKPSSKKIDSDCRVTNRPQDTSLTPLRLYSIFYFHLHNFIRQTTVPSNCSDNPPHTPTLPATTATTLFTPPRLLSTLSPPIGCDTYFHNTDDRPPK